MLVCNEPSSPQVSNALATTDDRRKLSYPLMYLVHPYVGFRVCFLFFIIPIPRVCCVCNTGIIIVPIRDGLPKRWFLFYFFSAVKFQSVKFQSVSQSVSIRISKSHESKGCKSIPRIDNSIYSSYQYYLLCNLNCIVLNTTLLLICIHTFCRVWILSKTRFENSRGVVARHSTTLVRVSMCNDSQQRSAGQSLVLKPMKEEFAIYMFVLCCRKFELLLHFCDQIRLKELILRA